MVNHDQDAEVVLDAMQDDIEGAARHERILQPKYSFPLILAFLTLRTAGGLQRRLFLLLLAAVLLFQGSMDRDPPPSPPPVRW